MGTVGSSVHSLSGRSRKFALLTVALLALSALAVPEVALAGDWW